MEDNTDAVLDREKKNKALFEKHPDLIIKGFPNHQVMYDQTFGKNIFGGEGILDIGTGHAGIFLLDHLTEAFLPPRVGIDVFEVQVPPTGWLSINMNGNKILERFGKNSFDHVQCMETLEHVNEDEATDIAKQMLKVSRRTCLITSCGRSHHLGELNKKTVDENKFLTYEGQPNIEDLMALGYNVRLIGNYQILAWYIK